MKSILFKPIKIGNTEIKNRIVFPPLTTGYEENYFASKKSINFYKTIAQGGTGLVIIGDLSASKNYSMNPHFYSDTFIPQTKKLVDAVHAADAKIAAQVYHGEYNPDELEELYNKYGIDAVKNKMHEDLYDYCNKISINEIHEIQDRIVQAAIRADKCGFDIIQIHGDRIAGMFSSPILNKRADEYGGSLENRSRFSIELVKKIRGLLPHKPLEYKLVLIRQNPPIGKGGPTIEEGKTIAKWLENVGIDSFHVSIANHGFIGDTIPAMGTNPFGCFVDLAEAIKSSVSVPVTAVGRIISPDMAENIIKSSKADMVALGRQLIADPEWPIKVYEERESEIRYCIMCNRGCTDNIMHRKHIQCAVNYMNGVDENIIIEKGEKQQKVIVVGAGLSGMQAALTMAQKGHIVTIAEKSGTIGGQLNLAFSPPGKEELMKLKDYYKTMLGKNNIKVELNTNITAEYIKNANYDKVILAIGAIPFVPPIKGLIPANAVTAWDVLSGEKAFGSNVVLVGAGSVGIETALYMAQRGSSITVVEITDKLLATEVLTLKPKIIHEIESCKIKILLKHSLKEIKNNTAIIENLDNQQELMLSADTIVIAIGSKPNKYLIDEIEKAQIPYIAIGDCSRQKVGLIGDAIRDGFFKCL